MAEEADVVVADITPDDFMADEQESPKAESSPAEDKKPEVVETPKEEAEAQAEAEPEAEEPDSPEAETPEAEKPLPKEDEKPLTPKSENRFQNLANENKELRRQVETLTAQVYQPATEEDLVSEVNPDTNENYTKLEAKFEAYRQNNEVEKFNSRVVEAQAAIGNESYQVLNDFPVFNPSSDQYDAELGSEAAMLLEANLIRDPNIPELDESGKPTGKGMVIGSNISPYQLYKTLARAQGLSDQKGQLKGQEAAEKMLANADAPSAAAPPKKVSDPVADLWKEPL